MTRKTKFTRYNFRSNIDININRYLSTRLDLGARITDRNAPGTTAGRLMTICATQPPYLPILVEENAHPQNEEYIQQKILVECFMVTISTVTIFWVN